MTLVVGCATPDIGFLVADTLLSFAFDLKGRVTPVKGESHALKIQILSPAVAVAFAGDVGTSLDFIDALQEKLLANLKIDPCEQLFATYSALATTASAQDCEFLVLQSTADGKKLARITSDGVQNCARAFIGDAAEYNSMRQLQSPYSGPTMQQIQQQDGTFHTIPFGPTEGEKEFSVVSDAMEALTHRRTSKVVGAIAGCVTRVVNARISGRLEYMQSVEASLTPWEDKSGFSLLTSNSEKRGIGIYYRSGRMGLLFVVGDREACHKERAETMSQFVEVARVKHGLNLVGGSWEE
jgi:hypothetical protein